MCVWPDPASSVSNAVFFKTCFAFEEFVKVSWVRKAIDF